MSATVPLKPAVKAPAVLFAGMTEAQAGKLAQEAFRVAAWMGQPQEDDPEWETPAQFVESLASAFELLLVDMLVQRGETGLAHQQVAYGARIAESLREVPIGWRPLYAPRGPRLEGRPS